MKLVFGLFLVLFIALAGIAPSPSLAESPPSYLVLKGGLYSPSKDFDIGATHFDRDDGFVAEVAAGHFILPSFATELGVGYFESKSRGDTFGPSRPSAGRTSSWTASP